MRATGRHVHLDPLGGIAGDMFLAATLDAFPALSDPCRDCIATLVGDSARTALEQIRRSGFAGARFVVEVDTGAELRHRSWADIRAQIQGSRLSPGVIRRAVDIFRLLAEAEAGVHGSDIDEVHFHEVGALDSIVDIVGAAFVIDALAEVTWSVSSLPLGSGTVLTRHGTMPVPAPATARLMEGFAVHDDGVPGERVTPTGAAVLCHLRPAMLPAMRAGRLLRSGVGFGARELGGRPNLLRALVTETSTSVSEEQPVAVVRFEIDDQTGEDLALALDRLRTVDGVLDVHQMPAFGKKGRMMIAVRALVLPQALDTFCESVFAETTTLGLRVAAETRRILNRSQHRTRSGVRVKLADRPGGTTAKAEMDDIADLQVDCSERSNRRRSAESEALQSRPGCPDSQSANCAEGFEKLSIVDSNQSDGGVRK